MNRLAHPPETKGTVNTEPKVWDILFTDEDGIIPPEKADIQFDVEYDSFYNTTTILIIDVPQHIKDRWFDYQEQIEDELRFDYNNAIVKF